MTGDRRTAEQRMHRALGILAVGVVAGMIGLGIAVVAIARWLLS